MSRLLPSDSGQFAPAPVLELGSILGMAGGTLETPQPVEAGEEVEYFASQLDRFTTDPKASAAEQRAHLFQLLDAFHTYSRKRVDRTYARQVRDQSTCAGRRRRDPSEMDLDRTDGGPAVGRDELLKVEEEAQTWDLLRRILPLRHQEPAISKAKPQSPSHLAPSTRAQWWHDFLMSDPSARERKVVLEWLQNSASHRPPVDEVVRELQQNADRGDIVSHGWLHTRTKIKLQKSVNGYQGALDPRDPGLADSHLASNTLVTQLDPDAITRQARKLEAQDQFFESAIWLGCYEMLRRGCAMSEIRDWCSVRMELWRASSIAPLPLSRAGDEDQAGFDPLALVRWRRTCFKTAREGGSCDYDRAVSGILAGDTRSVEKMCKSWDDFLFAHYNALLRSQFDSFLLRNSGEEAASIARQLPASSMSDQHVDVATTSKRLLASLEADKRTASEAMRHLKVLQGAIVANDLDRYLFHQGIVLSKAANATGRSKLIPNTTFNLPDGTSREKFFTLGDFHTLRVAVHGLIVNSALEQLHGQSQEDNLLSARHQVQEKLLVSYISFLRLAGLMELIPLYCSKLSSSCLYETLGRSLASVSDPEERLRQLGLMKKLGLDLFKFARAMAEEYLGDAGEQTQRCEAKGKFKILEDGPATLRYGRIIKPDFFGDEEEAEPLTEDEEMVIRAMEWLLLVPGHFKETCEFVIRAYKYFFKRMSLGPARHLCARVPGLAIVNKKTPLGATRDVEAGEDAGLWWFEELSNAQLPGDFFAECGAPKDQLMTTAHTLWELECLVRELDCLETMAAVVAMHKETGLDRNGMQQRATNELRLVKTFIDPLLGNFLLVVNEDDPDLTDIREAYLPETILAYISALHFAGTSYARDNLLESMELASVIAARGSDVAAEFQQCGRMRELLEAFASCSKALAIWATDSRKGSQQTTSKKLRTLGWSRELWSVQLSEEQQ